MEREHGPVIAYCVLGERKEQLATEGQLNKLAREQEKAARIAPLRREGATPAELKALDEWFTRTTGPARNKAPNHMVPTPHYPGQVLDHVCGFKGIIKRTPHKTCPACSEERRFKDVEVISVERVKRSTKRIHVLAYVDDDDMMRYPHDELKLKLTKVSLPIGTRLQVRWIKPPRQRSFKLEVRVPRDEHIFVPVKGSTTNVSYVGRALLDLKLVDVVVERATHWGGIVNPKATTSDDLYTRLLDATEIAAAEAVIWP